MNIITSIGERKEKKKAIEVACKSGDKCPIHYNVLYHTTTKTRSINVVVRGVSGVKYIIVCYEE